MSGAKTAVDTLSLPESDAPLRTEHRYIVCALQIDGTVEVGVRPPVGASYTVDSYPDAVQDRLEALVEETLDFERVRAEAAHGDLVSVGVLDLARIDDASVELEVQWDPGFVDERSDVR